MDRVFSQQQRPISDVSHAAIAIRSVNLSQRHIGVLHREDGVDEVHLLHLAWHHDLKNSLPGPVYFWVDLDVPSRRLRQVAAICRKVWRSNQGTLPYALSPPNDCFDHQTGEFLLGPTRRGLTCASFVLAIFEEAGLRLAHYATWPTNRSGDREWQEWVIEQLENGASPATAEHIEAVKGEVGAVRYRPEDVAGAATVSPLPADFATSEKRAAGILDRLSGG